MKTLKKFVKKVFIYCFQIEPIDDAKRNDLTYACDGRIVRSLSDSKKEVCAVYILGGIDH